MNGISYIGNTTESYKNTQTNKINEYKKRTEIEQHHLNTANTENTTQRIHKIVNETTPTTITKETENNSVT